MAGSWRFMLRLVRLTLITWLVSLPSDQSRAVVNCSTYGGRFAAKSVHDKRSSEMEPRGEIFHSADSDDDESRDEWTTTFTRRLLQRDGPNVGILPLVVAPAPSPASLERDAVLYFKGELTADPTGVFQQWNDTHNPDPCNWYGIKCGHVAGVNTGRITELRLPGRMLQGNLTRRVADLPFLEVLDLSGNLITGILPDEISTLQHLRILRLGGNTFQGPILWKLTSSVGIEELDLHGCNIITDSIDMMRNFTSLSVLNLGENSFTGPIPIWLGQSVTLRYLHLGGNKLSGDVPDLINCTSLRFLNLSANNFTGSVDSMNLKSLTHLDFSHNRLVGRIPVAVGEFSELVGLNLSGNGFTGSIPNIIGLNLANLQSLDLSMNQLSGMIPDSIANMTSLVFLNVSVNDLQGRVPETDFFRTMGPDSFLGNPGLCGKVVKRSCPGDVDAVASSAVATGDDGPRRNLATIIGSAAEACALVVVVALLGRYLVHRRRRRLGDAQSVTVLFSKYFKALKLTAAEIQAATTSSTSSSDSAPSDTNLVGVFNRTLSGTLRRAAATANTIQKAVLPDGTVFAVKEWNVSKFRKKDRHKLTAEMEIFSRIRHPNLVRLMGYYLNPTTLAMLMEFVPSGNLDSQLHPPGQQSCQLKWKERLRIIMGVTTGLVHLHHETCDDVVVHCDVKAANVLLDSDMEPKLVDFGMVSFLKRTNNSGDVTAASCVGLSGYLPPEYVFSSDFTRAGDVYSYGVLLLELVTGKRPTSEDVGPGVTLPEWVRSLKAQDRERYAIDMGLFQSADEPEINQMLYILNAALSCTSYTPDTRPCMLQVLDTLQEMPESDAAEEELVPVVDVDSSSPQPNQDDMVR